MKPISDEAFLQLVGVLESFLPLGVKCKQMLRQVMFEVGYKRGCRILNFREKQTVAWFMLEGMAREIKTDAFTFQEHTVWFWLRNSFLYTTPGFFSQEESMSTIEIVQDCKLVQISYESWVALKRAFPETDQVTEKIRGAYNKEMQELADDIKYQSTAFRYEKYKPRLQVLFSQVKLKFIAGYLGMSADRLGKLRKSG